MRTLYEVEKEFAEAEKTYRAAVRAEQNAAMCLRRLAVEVQRLRTGLAVGALVSTKEGKTFRVAEITKTMISGTSLEKPWVDGYLVKKDGSLSTRIKHLYTDWTVCQNAA